MTFLTQDDPEKAPVDIRPYEFIVYALDRHAEFLAKLDNAVVAIFTEQHQDLYNEALDVLEVFNRELGASYGNVDLQEFQLSSPDSGKIAKSRRQPDYAE